MSDFHSNIVWKIEIINSILEKVHLKRLGDRDCVFIPQTSDSYFASYLLDKNPFVRLAIEIGMDYVQIGIDRIAEAIVWNDLNIKADPRSFEDEIYSLLSGEFNVRHCGQGYTRVKIFRKGVLVKDIKYVSGLFNWFGCDSEQYPPLCGV
ncbi:hypothetical protein [Caballeronia sp. LZ032]|uniref:hypothetical protein n=1 Tax=Caballeronia sp. LZ032 TaxID=3038565 RepID=UPI002857DBE1|nr:hypothetical protein [Caballeronia sp. LZ032]MDR5881006.1 hypothetical protein [Caballeronia sp. LZ032]